MIHSFDTDIAKEYGVNAAVLFQNIVFWIDKNAANEKHFHDGQYWTYNSRKAFGELFPYMTDRQIWYALESLIKGNMIIKGDYNANGMNHTAWYALGDEGKKHTQKCTNDCTPLYNPLHTNVQPHYIYTDNKQTDIKERNFTKKETQSEVKRSGVPNYEELDRLRRLKDRTG